jgi:outer membrane protein assembly factor BamB
MRKWIFQTQSAFEAGDHGTEFSNPIVIGNTLVFGSRNMGLTSVYPLLKQKRWSLPIQGGVVSELASDSDFVYFGGGDGFLYCVQLENGRIVWRYDLRNPIISRPTLYEGKIFITTSDDTVFSFDAITGKWLWHYKRRSTPLTRIYGASAPLVTHDEVIAGMSDGFLITLKKEDGHLLREMKLQYGRQFTDVNAHPVLENAVIYIASYDGALYAIHYPKNEILWKIDAGGSKDISLEEDHLFFPSSSGAIYSIDKKNAKINWKFELDRGTPTQLIITKKYVIFGSSYQYLYVIDKSSGKGLYRFNVGFRSGFFGSPAFDPISQRVYFLSSSGNLYSFLVK